MDRQAAAGGLDPRTLAKSTSAIRCLLPLPRAGRGATESNPPGSVDSPRTAMRIPRASIPTRSTACSRLREPSAPVGAARRGALRAGLLLRPARSEAVDLTVDRVSLQEGIVRVMGKGSRERLVPMGATGEGRARPLPRARCGPLCSPRARRPAALFVGRAGRKLSRKTVWKSVQAPGAAGRARGEGRTRCATPSPRTCCRAARTCAPCRSCSATRTSRPPRSTRT